VNIKPNTFYRTRYGDKAFIHTVNGIDPNRPVVGEVYDQHLGSTAHKWRSDGRIVSATASVNGDLVEEWKDDPLKISLETLVDSWSGTPKVSFELGNEWADKRVKVTVEEI